ncbi:curli assembly protein CsgF [Aurantibacter crassamenti]|uniref:curli production assembly/transport component CsgF n=1 Tax=Aurantibacter crassamenti TaxID=1837375 RepID=UPI00193A075E|nr:curli production assembly/transport component CsgF [Aurantibacter crassamenti]MBM1106300.1 curli assembly protein CsgF [Aurantibacter crassamenti]
MKRLLFILALTVSSYSFAQQMVYTPVNPAFGGNTFNYQWLLSSAESQNSFKDPANAREEQTDLERFQENLNNQLLSSLSRNVFSSQLGEELQEGSFNVGDLALEIFESGEGLVINILDTITGEQTQIIVPN